MSSGVALLATATAADAAANKVNICHATSSDTNPYVFIQVDDDSAKLKGHLMHREDPNKKWKSDGTYEGKSHSDGDAKPDLIGSFTDDQNVFHAYDGDITSASCDGDVEVAPAIADVDFTDPDCDNENTASYDPVGQHVTFSLDGTVGPGEEVTVTATADEGYTFDGESTKQEFPHKFGPIEENCEIVNPPSEVTPVEPEFVDPTCDVDADVVLPSTEGVKYDLTGDKVAGGTVSVDATAIEPNVLAEGATTHWEHTFPEATDCTEVSVPETPEGTVVTTPTVVHAGLTGPGVASDLRGEQGLVLLVSGMILMLIAGGLGLRTQRGAARS